MANAINNATFATDDQNHITIQGEGADLIPGLTRFRSQQELEALTAQWPTSKLVDLWNGIPGSTPVKKFTNRSIAIRRIWTMLERKIRPEPTSPATKPKVAKSNKKAPSAPGAPTTKSETVLALLR